MSRAVLMCKHSLTVLWTAAILLRESHLERSIILEDVELKMLDDVKRYMLLRKKRTSFFNKIYKKTS